MRRIQIDNRMVGDGFEPLIIAEIGINHEGSLDSAIEMAESAINAGAEVIKHQTHIIDDEMSIEAHEVIPGNTNVSIYEVMNRCALSEEDEKKLMEYIRHRKCIFLSTPFSKKAVDRLVSFDVPAFKVGSGECNNYPLLEYIASFRKPVILSTGMNSIESIRKAVSIFKKNRTEFALLHCTNVYPTPSNLVRLGAMTQMQEEFKGVVIGLSDHTTSNYASFGAIALGASIIERHFTDSMSRPGPDICCSMDPSALKDLLRGANEIFQMRGGVKGSVYEEEKTLAFASASVVAVSDIVPGERLTHDNTWVMRPGGGDFSAEQYQSIIGAVAIRPIKSNTQIKKNDIQTEH